MRLRTVVTCLACAAAAALLTGCGGPAEREDAAREAALRFTAGVEASDGTAACAALAPATVEELEHAEKTGCPEAVTGVDLPAPGSVTRVDVYGRQARVVAEHDTLFLSSFADGWRVTAAGCEPRSADEPYRCELEGR